MPRDTSRRPLHVLEMQTEFGVGGRCRAVHATRAPDRRERPRSAVAGVAPELRAALGRAERECPAAADPAAKSKSPQLWGWTRCRALVSRFGSGGGNASRGPAADALRALVRHRRPGCTNPSMELFPASPPPGCWKARSRSSSTWKTGSTGCLLYTSPSQPGAGLRLLLFRFDLPAVSPPEAGVGRRAIPLRRDPGGETP